MVAGAQQVLGYAFVLSQKDILPGPADGEVAGARGLDRYLVGQAQHGARLFPTGELVKANDRSYLPIQAG